MAVQRIQSTDPAWAWRFLPAILPGDFLIGKSTCHVPRLRTLTRVYLPQLYPYLMAAARGGLSLIRKIVLVVELPADHPDLLRGPIGTGEPKQQGNGYSDDGDR